MSAKEYSILIEIELRKVNSSMYGKSNEILLDPYTEIILASEQRVPLEKLNKFKLYYQAICGKALQELIDSDYDLEQLIKDLKKMVEGN